MRNGDGRVRLTGVELGDRDVEGISMRTAGIVINLQPVFVGQTSWEEWFHSGGRSAPGLTIITGLLKNDVTAIGSATIDTSNIGIPIQVITYTRITFTEATHEGVQAVSCPLLATIARTIETLDIGAIIVVRTGEQVLLAFGVGGNRHFVCGSATLRSLLVG